jgi:protein-disulfide isomerase
MKLAIPVSAHDHVQGPADAPLTLVEYGDFECSYCGKAYPSIKAVQRALGPKLRFVCRHFPLTELHPHALHAAEVAEATARHHKFWEMHDTLFEHQRALDDAHLLGYAKQHGLDPEKIATEASTDAVIARIRADLEGGQNSGVSGTPSFYVNGSKYDDAYDPEPLMHALERALPR